MSVNSLKQWRLRQLRQILKCRTTWAAPEVEPKEHPSQHNCRLTLGHPGYCRCVVPDCKAMHISYIHTGDVTVNG